MPNYIRANTPATMWLQGRQRGEEQARADEQTRIAAEQAGRERTRFEQSQGADKALRTGVSSIYPQPVASATTSLALPSEPEYGGPAQPSERGARAIGPTSQRGDLIRSLAGTPGTGQAVMGLHTAGVTADAQSERERNQAEIEALKALNNAQPEVGAAIVKRYKLNIPEQLFRDQRLARDMKALGDQIKAGPINDDATTLSINQRYLQERVGGADHMSALNAAFQGAKAPAPKTIASDWVYDSMRGAFIRRPQGAGGSPEAAPPASATVVPPNLPARPAGAGGGGSKAREFAEWRVRTLVGAGVPEQQANQLVAGGATMRPPSRKEVIQLANQLMKQVGRDYRPLYTSLAAAIKAVEQALGTGQPATGPGAGGAQPDLAGEAREAIGRGADAAAVKERYKKLTGQDLTD